MVNNQYVMSQVKKLQTGGSSPKTYGHLIVDGIDYGNSEELYNAFANHARSQGLNQGEFYDQWLTALRNGQDVVFGNGNTVNMQPKDMSAKRAGKRSGWTKFWDDTFDTRRNHFSDAIATARGFTFTPKEKAPEAPKAKDVFNTDQIILNYNPDPKNKKRQTWSTTHTNNALAEKRVADALAWMTNPDQFNYEDNDRIAAAYGRAKGSDGTGDPNAFAENIWNVMRNYQGIDFKDPDVQNALDWLEAFGIGVDRASVPAGNSGGSSGSGVEIPGTKEFKGPDGKIYIADKNGNLSLKEGQDVIPVVKEETPVVDSKIEASKPTLITPEMANRLGLGDEYKFGLIWQGEYLTPEKIKTGGEYRDLLYRMTQVADINNKDMSQKDRFKAISEFINLPSIDNYIDWTPGSTIKGVDLDDFFKNLNISSAAITNRTRQDGSDNNHIYLQYFNNREPGNNPWGFRSPYIVGFQPNGEVYLEGSLDDANFWSRMSRLWQDTNTLGKRPFIRPELIESMWKPKQYTAFITGEDGKMKRITDNFSVIKSFMTDDISAINGHFKFDLLRGLDGKYYIFNKINNWMNEVSPETAEKIASGKMPSMDDFNGVGLRKLGGKIDFNKINAFAKGGKVVKAAGGFSQAMWDLVKGMSYNPSGTSTSTINTGYNPSEAAWTITKGGQDTSLVTDALNNQRALNTEATLSSINNPRTVSTQQFHKPVTEQGDYGDPNYNSTPAWISLINAGLGALDYGSMAWGRHRVHDQMEKGLKDSLYKRVTPRLQGITDATPIEDAAVSRYDQYVQRGLTTPLTSDNVVNTQNVLTLQANALQGRDQAVRQQSTAALQRQIQNQQIANQQNTIDADAENDFRARLSGLRMNLAQNDASLTAQTAQSIQNLAREWRAKFNEQTAKYNQLQYNAAVSGQTELSDNIWKNYLRTNHSDAWNTWNNMSAADRNKYGNDITTWIQQSDYWNNALENEYLNNRKILNQKILGAYKDYNLSPELSWLYKNRYGVPVKKSGGTLTIKQRNRYKNEPWEDIWINQNKATHKLVAKLNDNVIKTFLKTLK